MTHCIGFITVRFSFGFLEIYRLFFDNPLLVKLHEDLFEDGLGVVVC